MISMKASEIARIVGGVLHGDDIEITAPASLDSRNVPVGGIFIAIKGSRVDGHDFVADAMKSGASIALTSRQVNAPCIVVEDVTQALGQLAHHVRGKLQELTLIGITGSQGKTTTKELLAGILRDVGEVVAPQGNLNNELGAPLTLLQCSSSTKYCIIEMGARHKGDIAHLADIAQPNIGVVLKVGTAHVGEFGSVQAIAEAKSELISHLSKNSTAILGSYDDYTPKMASLHNGKSFTFGESSGCDIRATDIEFREGRAHFDLVTPEGRAAVGLRVVGLHQVANALAVAAVCTVLGLTLDQIAGGLSTIESQAKWRMEVTEIADIVLINDAYNASPESMEAALSTLVLFAQERGGQSWAFLGKMHELGDEAPNSHAAIGVRAAEMGIDHLVCVGAEIYARDIPATSSTVVHDCVDISEALHFSSSISAGDVVLVKASRSEKLEELATSMANEWKARVSEA